MARFGHCKKKVEFYELKTRVCSGRHAVEWKSLVYSLKQVKVVSVRWIGGVLLLIVVWFV
jgi:hypothetical protein